MNKRRKNRDQQPPADRQGSLQKSARGSVEFRALMSEFGQLRESVAEAATGACSLEATLAQQNQAILSIAESLADVRDLVTSLRAEVVEDVTVPANEEATTEVVAEHKTSEWDRIRDAFLAETSQVAEPSEEPPQNPVAIEAVELKEDCQETALSEEEELDDFLSELPGAVPLPTTNDANELRKFILDRDRTIAMLVQRLQKRSRKEQNLTAEQLADIVENCPDELTERVESSLKLLNQQVRLGELELSLERARVSRQLSRLEETRERLESNARSLGLSINEDGTINGEADVRRIAGSKGRRWLGVLGFSH